MQIGPVGFGARRGSPFKNISKRKAKRQCGLSRRLLHVIDWRLSIRSSDFAVDRCRRLLHAICKRLSICSADGPWIEVRAKGFKNNVKREQDCKMVCPGGCFSDL